MGTKNIVVLHGWQANRNKLDPLVTYLRKNNWNVFFPILPGFDGVELKKAYKLDDFVLMVESECKKKFMGEKYFIFGHSFGGRIAVKLAVSDKKLSGLILCASGGFSRGKLQKRILLYFFAKIGKLFMVYPPLGMWFKKVLYKLAREHDYEKTSGLFRDTFKNIISENLKTHFKNIDIPTLILWGRRDRMTPFEDAVLINNNIRNSSLVDYKNEGHTLPYVRSEELVKEIELWYQRIS